MCVEAGYRPDRQSGVADTFAESDSTVYRGAGTQEVDPDLLDAFVRPAELTEKPEQILVMRDMLMRGIHYRLLAGAFGNTLRSLDTHCVPRGTRLPRPLPG